MSFMSSDIKTVYDFLDALENGPYAWPGGYPIYFVMSDGEALSFNTANEKQDLIIAALEDGDKTGGWMVIGADINWEDDDLIDAHSGEKIECAYCEDED